MEKNPYVMALFERADFINWCSLDQYKSSAPSQFILLAVDGTEVACVTVSFIFDAHEVNVLYPFPDVRP